MKLQRNQFIEIAIALIFIFYGIAHSIFKFNVAQNIVNDISFILIVIAGFLWISDHKKK